MFISLKAKILLTILLIVSLFTFFILVYFPAQQHRFLLNSYNNEVQNLSNTVALGVRIALNEQDYEGVRTAMEFVKENPALRFVSLLEYDTVWNSARSQYKLNKKIFKTYPEGATPKLNAMSSDSLIVKEAGFQTPMMSGAIMLGFSTGVINESEKRIFQTSLLISAAIFLVGLLIGVWTSQNLAAPIVALRNASQRIGKGELITAEGKFSNDETGDLARTFNTMVHRLSSSREELHATNRELSKANDMLSTTLENLKATQTQLIQTEKMASLGELTAGIAHEIQNPLNFVNNFADLNSELMDDLEQEAVAGNIDEMKAVIRDLKENSRKINHHGKRADSIVKAMLQHSRQAKGQAEPTDINALCDEYLRLSYHGMRAKDKTFNADFKTAFDETIGKVPLVSQDVGRVLLNLFNNAFFAVAEKAQTQSADFKPMVLVQTRKEAGWLQIRVEDNGAGIPQAIVDKIFQPFFTTKPTGQGTGLGLSMAHDIITKEHGGTIKAESRIGEGTAFVIHLPLNPQA